MASQSTIQCVICKQSKGISKDRIQKLSEADIKAYTCRSCKSQTKQTTTTAAGKQANIITCCVCNQSKGITKDRLAALKDVESYVCRSCKPSKAGARPAKAVVKDTEEPINHTITLSDWMKNWTPAPRKDVLKGDDFSKIDACFRPDIFFGNKKANNGDGACNGCPMFAYCGCNTKVWSAKLEKIDLPKKKR
jgi:uncharacterized protein YlaI